MVEPIEQDYYGDNHHDDPRIDSASKLARHCRTPVQIVPCQINGWKISDQAFVQKGGVSVDLECILSRQNLPLDHRYGLMQNTKAMISVTAGQARAAGGGVAWTPKPYDADAVGTNREENLFHGEIIGRLSGKNRRDLASIAVIVRREKYSDIFSLGIGIS
jgi:hypothetical protein